MYELSQDRWTATIVSDVTVNAADDITSISVGTGVAVPEARDRLLNGAVILALYRTLETMVLQNSLYEVDSEILYLGVLFGDIKAFVFRDHILLNAGTDGSLTNGSDLASSLRSTSGHIIDADDADFKITYTYECTRRINRYQLFLAFLDGLANAAEPNEVDLVRDECGISPTGEAVIRIYQNYDRPDLLSHKVLKRAMFLVWDRIVLAERMFGNMRGRLEYAGVEIGTFWIHE